MLLLVVVVGAATDTATVATVYMAAATTGCGIGLELERQWVDSLRAVQWRRGLLDPPVRSMYVWLGYMAWAWRAAQWLRYPFNSWPCTVSVSRYI